MKAKILYFMFKCYVIILVIGLIGCNNFSFKITTTPPLSDNQLTQSISTTPQNSPTSIFINPTGTLPFTTTPTKTRRPTITPSITPTPVMCPDWIFENQEYSQSQWDAIPKPRKPKDYIEFQFTDLPLVIDWVFWGMIDDSDYQTILINNKPNDMLWFIKVICEYKYKIYFEVIDVLELPIIQQGELLITLSESCRINDETDPEIIAVVVEEKHFARQNKIKYAWRANRITETFEILPTNGIVCITDWADEENLP